MAVAGYLDGLGERGLAALLDAWRAFVACGALSYFEVWRVPLGASDEAERSYKGRRADEFTWQDLREAHGVGRYEVVLMGPPPQRQLTGWQRTVQRVALAVCPWLDTREPVVPRGRASAACFDAVDWGLPRPMPRPLATREQPSLFNPEDVTAPYVRGSDTSLLAAEAIAPFISQLQQRVLDAVKACGERGATCDEVEALLGMVHQTCSARINELRRPAEDGSRPAMLIDSGGRRLTRQQQLATVWLHRDLLFG